MFTSKPIKIWFSDFWPGFDIYNNYFTSVLKQYFNIEINSNPDYLIHSVYSRNFLKYKCIRICYTGENTRPDYKSSDFHIGFDRTDNTRYLRWPLFLLYYSPEKVINLNNIDELANQKTRFCSFVVSNDKAKERIEFYKELSRYKRVDSGGKFLNNIGAPVEIKMDFIKSGKFCIAYENETHPGYTTEKIWEPFLVKSIPIYWGNPNIASDFNPKSFINAHNFKTNKELIEYITLVDTDNKLYKSMINEPCFINNIEPEVFKITHLLNFFDRIFSQVSLKPVANISDSFKYFYIRLKLEISTFVK